MRHAIAIAALFTAGCAPTRPVHYYTLDPVTAASSQSQPGGPTLVVGLIATPEYLQDARIRYRTGTNETGSYEYHRWSERPGALVQEALVRALRASGNYRRVLEPSSTAAGDYLVRGKLHEFTEVDDPGIETKISLHLEMADEKTGRTVWDHHYERAEPASGKDINDVVQSMDRNLRQVVSEATADLAKAIPPSSK